MNETIKSRMSRWSAHEPAFDQPKTYVDLARPRHPSRIERAALTSTAKARCGGWWGARFVVQPGGMEFGV